MIVEENIFVMLMHETRFKEFIIDEISDTSKSTEVLTALSASSRQEVDETLAKALSLGGKEWRPIMDYGFMYGCSFQGPGRPCLGIGLYGAAGGRLRVVTSAISALVVIWKSQLFLRHSCACHRIQCAVSTARKKLLALRLKQFFHGADAGGWIPATSPRVKPEERMTEDEWAGPKSMSTPICIL